VLEPVAPERRDLVAVSHALILLIQLMLHPVKTLIYYDSPTMAHPLAQDGEETEDRYRAFFHFVLASGSRIYCHYML
jgi:hypothetical protein